MKHVTSPAAFKFWLRLADNLAQVESRGIRIDKDYLDGAITQVAADIADLQRQMQAEPEFRVWRRRFQAGTKLGGYDQISEVVFGDLGFKPKYYTAKKGRASANAENLETVDLQMVRLFLAAAKLKKALDTYLIGIRREMVQHSDGLWYVHPSYSLNSVLTFRSSCSNPNYQNQPKRNPRIAEIVRRCYIPRPGHQLGEDDFGQIEVRVPVPITDDPVLRDYVCDPSKDMHYDMACQLFKLARAQVSKALRNIVKGAYVFATFYGSYYGLTARDLWEDIDNLDGKPVKLEGSDRTVREHLTALGITELGDPDDVRAGTWVAHVKSVDEDFWGSRFRVYAQWKREWYDAYLREGGFTFPTGFACHAPGLDKKQVCNAPIQGCLPGTARVLTSEGHLPIRELAGRRVNVWTGFRWASAVGFEKGVWQRARVTLSSGLVVDCDTRHKFKNENDEWVEFPDLKRGDHVALPRCSPAVPYRGAVGWWFLYGFLLGDGAFSERGSVSICGGESKYADLEKIAQFLVTEGYPIGGTYRGLRWRETAPSGRRTQTKKTLVIQNNKFRQRLEQAGFSYSWRAKTKRIPEAVWRAPPEQQREFLEGLWRSDGSRDSGRLNMANAPLLREVQRLAAALGFDSQLRTEGRTDGGGWLSFHWARPAAMWDRRFPTVTARRLVPKVISKNYARRNEYISDQAAHKRGDISQHKAERMVAHHDPGAEVYRYDQVVDIETIAEAEMTYTMSVDDPLHQFVADGVITKNSGFHLLGWSLCEINERLVRRRMRSQVIGEIHDSITMDIHPAERDDVFELANRVMTERIREFAPWLDVPLVAESEIAPIGASWYDLRALKESDGRFLPAAMDKWEAQFGPWSNQVVA